MGTLGVHHTGFAVADLAKTTAFFTDCLGWKVVQEVPEYPAKFVTDGTAFFTLWQTDAGATPFDRRKNIGLHHVALKVGSEDELKRLFTKIQNHPGVQIEFAPELLGKGPARHCMFREPGGIRMELVWAPQ